MLGCRGASRVRPMRKQRGCQKGRNDGGVRDRQPRPDSEGNNAPTHPRSVQRLAGGCFSRSIGRRAALPFALRLHPRGAGAAHSSSTTTHGLGAPLFSPQRARDDCRRVPGSAGHPQRRLHLHTASLPSALTHSQCTPATLGHRRLICC